MSCAPLTRPAPTTHLDVLHAELIYLDRAIPDLRDRVLEARGRNAFDLGRCLADAVRRREDVRAEIAAVEVGP